MQRLGSVLLLGMLMSSVGCGGDASGTACGLDNPCPLGSYCDGGTCRTDCDPADASSCSTGVCTSYGQCAATQPDPDAGLCAAMVVEATFGIPTVALLVDQSGSMDTAYSTDTRWTVLRDALIDPTTGVVTRLQSTMRFGLTLFTSSNAVCPALQVVDPALNNLDAITTVYAAAAPTSATPTGESIDQVTQALSAYAEPGPKYIILASDGEPNTCADTRDTVGGQAMSVAAAQAAFAAGIKLYFLSVGSGTISADHMQDMANAGVGYPIGGTLNAPYWEAGDATQLTEAFDAITGGMISCDLTVNGTIDPSAATSGVIYLDGTPLVLHQDWEPVDTTSFQLIGSACTEVQRTGDHTVTASFGCEAAAPAGDLSTEGGGLVDGGCAATSSSAFGAFGMLLALGVLAGLRRRRQS